MRTVNRSKKVKCLFDLLYCKFVMPFSPSIIRFRHFTINARKLWASQKVFQVQISKIYQINQTNLEKNGFVHGFLDTILHCTVLVSAPVES